MQRISGIVSKSKKPKFDLELKIIDLNNVPLVSGTSYVKWHLPSSVSAEHRGRTNKVQIKEHKVVWDYATLVPIRFPLDKSLMLQEILIHFEILQEYSSGVGSRNEKIKLGHLVLNLAEYVDVHEDDDDNSSRGGESDGDWGGVTRRYLMQESKINSTLNVGIHLKQVDGERNYIAPPLRTAPVFGGIAGIIGGEGQVEQDDPGQMPSLARSREVGELQDMYRRSLAAWWTAQAGELPADQCIEDIFAGGDGWGNRESNDSVPEPRKHKVTGNQRLGARESSTEDDRRGTEAPERKTRQRNHRRSVSAGSDRSQSTVTEKTTGRFTSNGNGVLDANGSDTEVAHHEHRGRQKYKRAREVSEFDLRDDLQSWDWKGGRVN